MRPCGGVPFPLFRLKSIPRPRFVHRRKWKQFDKISARFWCRLRRGRKRPLLSALSTEGGCVNSPLTSLNLLKYEYEWDFEADLFCSRLHGEADLCRLAANPF